MWCTSRISPCTPFIWEFATEWNIKLLKYLSNWKIKPIFIFIFLAGFKSKLANPKAWCSDSHVWLQLPMMLCAIFGNKHTFWTSGPEVLVPSDHYRFPSTLRLIPVFPPSTHRLHSWSVSHLKTWLRTINRIRSHKGWSFITGTVGGF